MRHYILALLLGYSCVVLASETEQKCNILNNSSIKGHVSLNKSCVFRQTIIIKHSNTTLNCNHSVLDGENRRKYGILVKGKGLKNVNIINCHVKNFTGNGIMVVSSIRPQRNGIKSLYYKYAPKSITIKNSTIENSGLNGVNFNAYVEHSTLENSIIKNSKRVGIYLSQSSRNINIIGNLIENNGKSGKTFREGLAIDSSAKNKIINNKFKNNGAGGVFLYKNCGEYFKNRNSVIRWQHSNNNLISNNYFYNELVGIWIASRQSKNQKIYLCGDKSVDIEGKYYKDYSNNNIILNNIFCNNQTGIIVEGDNNLFNNNLFNTSKNRWIIEPYEKSKKPDGKTSIGNIYTQNTYSKCGL